MKKLSLMYMRNIESKGIIFCAILSSLCVLSTSSGMYFISTIITLLYAVYAGSKSADKILVYLALAIPNTRSMEAFGVSGAILACTVFLFNQIVHKKKLSRGIFILGLIYLVYSLQFIIRFYDFKIGLIMPIKMVIMLWTLEMVRKSIKKEYFVMTSILYITDSMFIGIMFAVIASIISGGNIARLTIVENDPNMLSIECTFLLAVYCIAYFERIISIKLFIFYMILLGLLVLMCGSRMGILLLIILIFVSLFMNINNIKRSLSLILICIFGVSLFLISKTGQNSIAILKARNSALALQHNISNNRFDLWGEYLTIFNSNKLFWFFGLGSYSYYGIESMAHNFLLEDLSSYGVIGTLIIYCAYYKEFKGITKIKTINIYKKLYFYIPFLIPIIGGLTLHGISSLPNFIMLFIGTMIICCDKTGGMEVYEFK